MKNLIQSANFDNRGTHAAKIGTMINPATNLADQRRQNLPTKEQTEITDCTFVKYCLNCQIPVFVNA